jgi:undecaprenyl-diphosphatase
MTYTQAVIIAIVEGITEFLPISSTGHMIIVEKLLGMEIDGFTKAFTVNIQFGAILSVVVLYSRRFLRNWTFYQKLFIAFLPAAVIGLAAGDLIDGLLGSVPVVAATMFLGGLLLLFVDAWFNRPEQDQEVSWLKALKIGAWQCVAMVPGVSRAAATIVGGMQQKLTRTNAAEFSFFLAVPTMAAASAYKLLKDYKHINGENIKLLLVGNVVAFVVGMLAIKTFVTYLQKHGFRLFGWYRICVGAALIILLVLGYDLKLIK